MTEIRRSRIGRRKTSIGAVIEANVIGTGRFAEPERSLWVASLFGVPLQATLEIVPAATYVM